MPKIQNLTHVYARNTKALGNVSLEIGPGMFGLPGPHRAGKSTLMRCVATLQAPTNGTMDKDVPIGAFLALPGAAHFDKSKILFLQNDRIRSGANTIHFTTDRVPTFAAIDPYSEWINQNSDDDITGVNRAN